MPRKKISATKSKQQNKRGGKKSKLKNQKLNHSANGANDSGDASKSHEAPRAKPCKFVMRTIFKNVSKMEENEDDYGEIQEHFGVKWCIVIKREEGYLNLYLYCVKDVNDESWTIDAEFDLKVVQNDKNSDKANLKCIFGQYNGGGTKRFMNWEDLLKDYVVNDEVKVEAHVNINKTTGIYKNNLRNFDETMSNFSNYVLIVKNEKFYVSKEFLAGHSLFFQTTLLGPVGGKKKPVYTLPGINSEDFQKYLEVLYGHATIDEVTVEGILLVANMYDTPVLIQKCEEFMLRKSEKSLKKQLEMSIRYKLEKLEKTCLSGIKTKDDILSVLPDDVSDLDQSILVNLFKKLLSFN